MLRMCGVPPRPSFGFGITVGGVRASKPLISYRGGWRTAADDRQAQALQDEKASVPARQVRCKLSGFGYQRKGSVGTGSA